MGLCRRLSGDCADSAGLPLLTGSESSLIYRLLVALNPFFGDEDRYAAPSPECCRRLREVAEHCEGLHEQNPLQHLPIDAHRQRSPRLHLRLCTGVPWLSRVCPMQLSWEQRSGGSEGPAVCTVIRGWRKMNAMAHPLGSANRLISDLTGLHF